MVGSFFLAFVNLWASALWAAPIPYKPPLFQNLFLEACYVKKTLQVK